MTPMVSWMVLTTETIQAWITIEPELNYRIPGSARSHRPDLWLSVVELLLNKDNYMIGICCLGCCPACISGGEATSLKKLGCLGRFQQFLSILFYLVYLCGHYIK